MIKVSSLLATPYGLACVCSALLVHALVERMMYQRCSSNFFKVAFFGNSRMCQSMEQLAQCMEMFLWSCAVSVFSIPVSLKFNGK
jgi:hypothetical protein